MIRIITALPFPKSDDEDIEYEFRDVVSDCSDFLEELVKILE